MIYSWGGIPRWFEALCHGLTICNYGRRPPSWISSRVDFNQSAASVDTFYTTLATNRQRNRAMHGWVYWRFNRFSHAARFWRVDIVISSSQSWVDVRTSHIGQSSELWIMFQIQMCCFIAKRWWLRCNWGRKSRPISALLIPVKLGKDRRHAPVSFFKCISYNLEPIGHDLWYTSGEGALGKMRDLVHRKIGQQHNNLDIRLAT